MVTVDVSDLESPELVELMRQKAEEVAKLYR
jgi:hypothetical protein